MAENQKKKRRLIDKSPESETERDSELVKCTQSDIALKQMKGGNWE